MPTHGPGPVVVDCRGAILALGGIDLARRLAHVGSPLALVGSKAQAAPLAECAWTLNQWGIMSAAFLGETDDELVLWLQRWGPRREDGPSSPDASQGLAMHL